MGRYAPHGGKTMSAISLADHVNELGAPFNVKSILAMIEGPMPEKRED
jgi:hypothetical protein